MLHYVITFRLFNRIYGFEVHIDCIPNNARFVQDTLQDVINRELPFEGCKYQLFQIV
jgi:hypothetical protein